MFIQLMRDELADVSNPKPWTNLNPLSKHLVTMVNTEQSQQERWQLVNLLDQIPKLQHLPTYHSLQSSVMQI